MKSWEWWFFGLLILCCVFPPMWGVLLIYGAWYALSIAFEGNDHDQK